MISIKDKIMKKSLFIIGICGITLVSTAQHSTAVNSEHCQKILEKCQKKYHAANKENTDAAYDACMNACQTEALGDWALWQVAALKGCNDSIIKNMRGKHSNCFTSKNDLLFEKHKK